ncbi:MAG: bis(5'-nucleosyl)-tetraphosphatase (symmetrical) YqeK [Ruthenibacterium sp.]
MISLDEARKLAKKNLSEKRFIHTMNVKNLAVQLAQNNGVDADKAALAALLHDIAKELPRQKLLQILAENDIIAGNTSERPLPIWHGVVASILAQTEYGVDDAEILSAIRCHTTGKANMNTLDKIIYMADMASAERTYPEAENLRRHVLQNLDKATLEGLGMSIAWLKAEGRAVDDETLAAYASLRQQIYGGQSL